MPKYKCKICNSHKIVKINLAKKKSLTSDGNIISSKLYKYKCFECGLFFNPKKYEIINYKRSSGSSKWEKIRHQNIAKGISKIYQDYISYKKKYFKVLEVGGGNYETSKFLNYINKSFLITCVEPFPETDIKPASINIFNNKLQYLNKIKKFDLIFSNNVIEHTAEPKEFLNQIEEFLSEGGITIICCPTQSQINYEMFFLDHLYHFSELSFYLLLKDTNLKMIDEFVSPWDKMTHCYILKKEFLDKKKIIKNRLKPINALKKRIDLANKWLNKDKELNVKIKNYKNKIFLFGSGEYSQILMCYAPIFFQKIEAIVVTDKQGSREFNTPIYLVKDIVPNTGLIFLGVRKEIEKNIRNLLLKQGWNKKNIIST